MQKKIIALAVAALASSAAFAQSNVTIYGIADASISATTNLGDNAGAQGGQTVYKVNSGTLSTSRIGFKGVEDLGNGLKALFVLEYGLAIDASQPVGFSTTASAVARQQFVGLTGGFGTVVAGHLQTAGLDFTVAGTALGGSTGLGATNQVGGGTLITAAGALARVDNAVAYISPSFAGLTFAVNHARVTETAGTTNRSDTQGTLLSASYDNGPISAGVILTKATMTPGVAVGSYDNVQEWGIRAGYDFKVVKLQGTYQQARNQAGGVDLADSKYALSLSAPIGASTTVIAEYAKAKFDSAAGNDDVKAATLAVTYALSKRTTAYAGAVFKRTENVVGVTPAAYVADTNTYAVGLRHMF